MLALHAVSHPLEAFRVLIGVLGVAGLVFWRAAFKIIIAAAVLLIALLVAAFALGFLQGIYHFM